MTASTEFGTIQAIDIEMTEKSPVQTANQAPVSNATLPSDGTGERFRLHPQAAHRLVGGEVFIVTGDRRFHRLQSRTAVDLFNQLVKAAQSGAEQTQLVDLIVGRYDVAAAEAEADVAQFIRDLVQRDIAIRFDV